MALDATGQGGLVQNKLCSARRCHVVVDSNHAMCSTHKIKAAEYQKERRKRLRDDGKCTICGSEMGDRKFICCEACRCKDRQRPRLKRKCKPDDGDISYQKPGETENQSLQDLGGVTELEGRPSKKQSLPQAYSPQQYTKEDIEAAHILLQLGKPRYNLRSLKKK
ncbi:hypothetical protein F5Y12DRAFT_797913 [Xylaria sp. FL1777]|nr:hypothetical protein F5Y12DRAFT_797913 [Xylaria sp. FL1777]